MPFNDIMHPALDAYRSAVEVPADFDAFWADTLKEARGFGGEAVLARLDSPLRLIEAYDVVFPGFGGNPIRGWLLLPAERSAPLPMVVQYVGYGGGRGFAHELLHYAAAGFAYFRMDTRGQGSGWSPGETPDPIGSTPQIPGMMTKGILNRADYYYRRLFTDGVRALDALLPLSFIDADRVAVTGGSQGGGVSLAVAGLDPRVKALATDVPFLCDFPRAVRIATRDPYGEIARFLATHRDKREAVFETLRYFDGVCFASRAKAPALFSAALMDNVCPPSTVYAAHAAYGGPKTMVDYEFNDHEGGGPYQQLRQLAWLQEVLDA